MISLTRLMQPFSRNQIEKRGFLSRASTKVGLLAAPSLRQCGIILARHRAVLTLTMTSNREPEPSPIFPGKFTRVFDGDQISSNLVLRIEVLEVQG